MLTRRAKAYSSSCSQIVLVYLQQFCRSYSWSVCHSRKSQKSTKPFILGVQSLSKSSMLIRLKSSSLVLVIGSRPMPICLWGYRFWCPRVQVFLNLENLHLDHQNLHSVLKISNAACSCLSLLILAHFAVEMCFDYIYSLPSNDMLECSRTFLLTALSGALTTAVHDTYK